MKTLLLLACCYAIGFSVQCIAQNIQLEGYVRNSKGDPIKGVEIGRLGKTDENGHFVLTQEFLKYWKAILFVAKGYKPKAVPIDPANPKLAVVLEEQPEAEAYSFPECSSKPPHGFKWVGSYLRLKVPKADKVNSGFDVDYQYFNIGVKTPEGLRWMRGGAGPMYADVYPSADQILKLKSFSYKRTGTGSDWRGITNDGHYWRYMGSYALFETYDYETDSKLAAGAFDAILDSACFQQPDWAK